MNTIPFPPKKGLWIAAQGNDMRGDDALGPLLIDRIQKYSILAKDIDQQWDFQFCPEHALRFSDYSCILLVDASTTIDQDFCLSRVLPYEEKVSASHSLSPSELSSVYKRHVAKKDSPTPSIWQLEIKAYQFKLGAGLSPQAICNLESAWDHLYAILQQYCYFMAFYALIKCH